ncbi:methanethiol S-methyltransferase [Roseibium sediminis]|uniref:methanethiol S-methyltransferase n=1 Tax=Roseibium sediminis TaxID=1775174 RepID=UPI00123D6D01|nr:methanethiol S-methyltransferase [Roseibium sediminis]
MGRSITFIYGIAAYAIFLATFLYSIGFVGNILVPKSIDAGAQGPFAISIVINLTLLSVFALQHSIMARPAFKRIWTKIIPKAAERSTYILTTCVALILIFAFWQPLATPIWDVSNTIFGMVLTVLFGIGWLVVLVSTFTIDHFDLFGLKQIYANLKERDATQPGFVRVGLYRFVRHPIMTGFLIAFWAAPTMSVGHLLFALVTTGYIFIAVRHLEEKDLIAEIGDDYRAYQREVPAFVPGLGWGR